MATTPVPAFAAPPDFPALSDRALGTYNSKAFAWAEAMQDTTGPNLHAIAVTAKANADDAVLSAAAAADQVPLAAAQVTLATTQAQLAADAANAAAATAGATQWVSGTTYTAGVCVWSPINLQVYRRKTTGAGTTDPSADGTNWSFVGAKPSLVRSARTSNTPIGAADLSTLIDITSGTFTQTFDAAASLGSGWYCYLRNSGTGDVTLDPDGAELIDGLTSYVIYPGECRLVQCDGTALRTVVRSAVVHYLHVVDQRASGTEGGASVASNITQTRGLNTVLSNAIPGASLAANVVTLPAGVYEVAISVPGFGTSVHKAFLYNTTDSTYQLIGTSATAIANTGSVSLVSGQFSISAPKTFSVRHFTYSAVATNGLGRATACGQAEVYTSAEFWRVG